MLQANDLDLVNKYCADTFSSNHEVMPRFKHEVEEQTGKMVHVTEADSN